MAPGSYLTNDPRTRVYVDLTTIFTAADLGAEVSRGEKGSTTQIYSTIIMTFNYQKK